MQKSVRWNRSCRQGGRVPLAVRKNIKLFIKDQRPLTLEEKEPMDLGGIILIISLLNRIMELLFLKQTVAY